MGPDTREPKSLVKRTLIGLLNSFTYPTRNGRSPDANLTFFFFFLKGRKRQDLGPRPSTYYKSKDEELDKDREDENVPQGHKNSQRWKANRLRR